MGDYLINTVYLLLHFDIYVHKCSYDLFFQFTSAQIVSISGAALQAYVQLTGTSSILEAMFLVLLIGLDFNSVSTVAQQQSPISILKLLCFKRLHKWKVLLN